MLLLVGSHISVGMAGEPSSMSVVDALSSILDKARGAGRGEVVLVPAGGCITEVVDVAAAREGAVAGEGRRTLVRAVKVSQD